MKTIVIVGAGLTGLSAGWFYRRRFPDHRLILVESAAQPGGNLVSEWKDDFLFEYGPRGVLRSSHAFFHLLHESGAWPLLKPGKKTASTRYLWYQGRFHQLGGNPLKMLINPALLRLIPALLREGSVPPGTLPDESIWDFCSRRLGPEATRFLVDGFITGVWAGDSRRLSIRSAFPTLWEAEKRGGSIRKGMKLTRTERQQAARDMTDRFPHPDTGAARFFSVQGGLQAFARHLVSAAAFETHFDTSVSRLEPKQGLTTVFLSDGTEIRADEVVLTGNASQTARLIRETDSALADDLDSIPSVPVATINLGYTRLAAEQSGFGFLIPSAERADCLGIIFNSGTFDGVAPPDGGCFTVMIGGAHRPELTRLPDADLLRLSRECMKRYLGIDADPAVTGIRVWKQAIPQYEVGHPDRVARIRERLAAHPGLALLGNWSGGIGLNDCVVRGSEWAMGSSR